MTLRYQSGEEIKKGDIVRIHGEPGKIEFVAQEPGNDETDWFIREYGGGVMVLESVSGRTFIRADQLRVCEDLEFISRAESEPR